MPPQIATLSALAVARQHLGFLDRICHVVRLGASIAAVGEHSGHVEVADGASELLRDVFGDANMSCRLIVGVASLPLGVRSSWRSSSKYNSGGNQVP
jgi:hypothetical protein